MFFTFIRYFFKNYPYVDDFVDEIDGEVFHDHYRIYDKTKKNNPLLKQMLKFWQFTDGEMDDYQPEVYWSDEEKEFGDTKDFESGAVFVLEPGQVILIEAGDPYRIQAMEDSVLVEVLQGRSSNDFVMIEDDYGRI